MQNIKTKTEAVLTKISPYRLVVLRTVMGAIFIYFGYTGVFNPGMWVSFVPSWTSFLGSPETLVKVHGILEILGGIILILGVYSRLVSALLFLNLLNIITTLKFGPVMVRDIGLLAVLFVLLTGKSGVKND